MAIVLCEGLGNRLSVRPGETERTHVSESRLQDYSRWTMSTTKYGRSDAPVIRCTESGAASSPPGTYSLTSWFSTVGRQPVWSFCRCRQYRWETCLLRAPVDSVIWSETCLHSGSCTARQVPSIERCRVLSHALNRAVCDCVRQYDRIHFDCMRGFWLCPDRSSVLLMSAWSWDGIHPNSSAGARIYRRNNRRVLLAAAAKCFRQ